MDWSPNSLPLVSMSGVTRIKGRFVMSGRVYDCRSCVSGKNNVLNEVDFLLGEAVHLIDERVYLLVGGCDRVLQCLPLCLAARQPKLGRQSQHIVHQACQ